jgi:hypothetical protein
MKTVLERSERVKGRKRKKRERTEGEEGREREREGRRGRDQNPLFDLLATWRARCLRLIHLPRVSSASS